MNKSFCIYLFTVLIVCVHCGTFHVDYCESDNITHYYIANDNDMANLQCYTSKAVLDDTFKWKLKRPNNTMDMLSETGPSYKITNVRTSDEGSYSCTFNTTADPGVPGDNTLCLITLALPVPNFYIDNTTVGSDTTFNININYNMTGSTEAVLPVSRVRIIKSNVIEFVCTSTISTPTKDNVASCISNNNGMLDNRLSLRQENSYIESFEVILRNVSNSDEGDYTLNVEATFSTSNTVVQFTYSSTWSKIATLIIYSIQPTSSMVSSTEPSNSMYTTSSNGSPSTTSSSASPSTSTDLKSVTESIDSPTPTAPNIANMNAVIITGSAIGVLIALVVIIVIVAIVLFIMKQERAGTFKLNGNKKTGGDDETVTPHTGGDIELPIKGMSEIKLV